MNTFRISSACPHSPGLAVSGCSQPALACADGGRHSPKGIEPPSKGQTVYVPIYSEIRHGNVASSGRSDSTLMSVLVSVRNTDPRNPIRIVAAPYYNTDGDLVRNSVPKPRVIPPSAPSSCSSNCARTPGVPGPTMRSSGKPPPWSRRRRSRPCIRSSRPAIRSPSFRAAAPFRNLEHAADRWRHAVTVRPPRCPTRSG
jgi:hypothetical protein